MAIPAMSITTRKRVSTKSGVPAFLIIAVLEVRNYLIGAALHWLREYHGWTSRRCCLQYVYRYDRDEEWIANEHGA